MIIDEIHFPTDVNNSLGYLRKGLVKGLQYVSAHENSLELFEANLDHAKKMLEAIKKDWKDTARIIKLNKKQKEAKLLKEVEAKKLEEAKVYANSKILPRDR